MCYKPSAFQGPEREKKRAKETKTSREGQEKKRVEVVKLWMLLRAAGQNRGDNQDEVANLGKMRQIRGEKKKKENKGRLPGLGENK